MVAGDYLIKRRDFIIKSFSAFVAGSALANTQSFGGNQQQPKFTIEGKRKLLDAIREVETGGEPNNGEDAIGDNGNALGPYQIWKQYWKDAVEFDKTIGGVYNDVAKIKYSEKIVIAYWNRYAPANASDEMLAKIHNGGPSGYAKQNTNNYWIRVRSKLR